MRLLPLAALLAASALLAGCAASPSPVGDAEAAHSGVVCPPGTAVQGFTAAGAPNCGGPSFAGFSCPEGEVVVGFDAAGSPACESLMKVAEAVYAKEAPSSPPSTPAKSIALSSSGAIASNTKSYNVAAATQGLKWSDLKLTLDGVELAYDGDAPADANNEFYVRDGSTAVTGTTIPSTTVDAGDGITIHHASLSGKTLRIIDAKANSVVLTLTIG